MNFFVYLAGPISGLTYDGGQTWREHVSAQLPKEIHGISPLRAKAERLKSVGVVMDSYADDPLTCDRGITTRDRFDCLRSDAVLFNFLGAKSVSVGTCMELGWADSKRIPIILVMEKSGNLHDHPMVRDVAGFRVETLDEAVVLLEKVLMPSGKGTHRPESVCF